jgi:hypothetical protein
MPLAVKTFLCRFLADYFFNSIKKGDPRGTSVHSGLLDEKP